MTDCPTCQRVKALNDLGFPLTLLVDRAGVDYFRVYRAIGGGAKLREDEIKKLTRDISKLARQVDEISNRHDMQQGEI